MAGTMQRALALLTLLLLGTTQVMALANIQELLTDAMTLTEKGMKSLAGGAQQKDDNSTPMNVQMAPLPYAIKQGTPRFFKDKGSKRTTMKHGPFKVQPMDQHNGMVDYLQLGAPMPCLDCTITWMQAGLEYPNGTYANANTSMWLHHTVFININNPDTVCGKDYYAKGERWFASGNERTEVNWCIDGTMPVGYYIGPTDFNVIEVELMNQMMEEQEAVMTVEYEWIPGKPKGFYDLTPVWLDIGGCTVASDMPPKSDTTFSYSMNQTYNPDWTGALIGMGAHLHDGGTILDITNKGTTLCKSTAYYGGPGFVGPSMSMSGMSKRMDDMEMEHISYLSVCYTPYVGMITPDDQWGVTAYYDYTKHAGMANTDGSQSDIMGISVMYAAKNMTAAERDSYSGKYTPNSDPPQPSYASEYMPPSPTSTGMGGMGGMSTMATMTMSMKKVCNPDSDSPGNLTADGIDLNDPDRAMDFLAAILDDTCLQVWSDAYARAFWYGIAVVIFLFAASNLARKGLLALRKRATARGQAPRPTPSVVAAAYGLYRSVSYPSIGLPSRASKILGIPTLGTSLMIASYLAFLMALNFIKVQTHDDQNLQSISVRAAWLSVAQLPLIILLTMKRNLIGWLTDVGYERLNVLHRWTSRGLLLTATIHFATQSVGWNRHGLFMLEWYTDDCPKTGVAAFVLLLWMNLSTLRPLRSLSYEFFVLQHFVTFVGFIVAIMYHIPDSAQYASVYIWISIGLYLAFKFLQLALTAFRNYPRFSRASFTLASRGTSSIGKSDPVVRVNVQAPHLKSWRPGSHVRLSVPRFGLTQFHPATIASTPSSAGGDLVFILQSHNGFTKRITRSAMDASPVIRCAVVDGPYGGLPTDLAGFESALLIAGSTGISFTLPILLDLAEKANLNGSRALPTRNVVFVWAVRRQDHVAWFEEQLASAQAALSANGINCEVVIHVTRENISVPRLAVSSEKGSPDRSSSGSTDGHVEKSKADGGRPTHVRSNTVTSQASSQAASTQSGPIGGTFLPLITGRPEIADLIADARERFDGEMAVACCGPSYMAADVRNAVARMQFSRQKKAGVWLHVEGFAW